VNTETSQWTFRSLPGAQEQFWPDALPVATQLTGVQDLLASYHKIPKVRKKKFKDFLLMFSVPLKTFSGLQSTFKQLVMTCLLGV